MYTSVQILLQVLTAWEMFFDKYDKADVHRQSSCAG